MAKKEKFRYTKAEALLQEISDGKLNLSEKDRRLLNSVIEKLQSWNLYEQREALFLKYMRELGTYTESCTEEMLSDEQVLQMARDLLPEGKAGTCTEWVDIYKDDKIVGFLIMSSAPVCHPDTDYLLNQTYILPEYRKQGLMSGALRWFMKKHPRSSYSIVILRKNKWARHFWQSFFDSIGYAPKPLSPLERENPDEMWVGYEPNPAYFQHHVG